jgi:hypothetical protein
MKGSERRKVKEGRVVKRASEGKKVKDVRKKGR